MNAVIDPTVKPTIDLSSPTLAADVAGVLAFHGLATVDPHSIISITDNGNGDSLVKLAAAHGLNDADPVTISGASVSDYNDNWLAVTVGIADTLATFIIFDQDAALPLPFAGNATGGQWSAP
jgi:hypothetical protein